MGEMADSSRSAIGQFETDIMQFADIAQKTHLTVSYAQVVSNASLTKVDHMIYMQNGYRAYETGEGSPEWNTVMVDHHQCRFGQWCETGAGHNLFGHLPSFQQLDKPHQRVHYHVHRALAAATEGWERDPVVRERLFHEYQEAEAASRDLIATISLLNEEKHQFEAGTANEDNEVELF